MTTRSRKLLSHSVRLLICALALWWVATGVHLNDQVVLVDGQRTIEGTVVIEGESVTVRPLSGEQLTLSMSQVAVDEHGDLKVTFGLKTAWANSNGTLLALAVGICLLVVFPLAWRFKVMLKVQRIEVGYWECIKLSLAGNFLNFAAPLGSNAGDIFKAYFASLHTDRKTEAVATVALDRIIGLVSIVLTVAIIALLSPAGSPLAGFRNYMLIVLGVMALGSILYLLPITERFLQSGSPLSKLRGFEHLRRLDSAARTYARNLSAVVASLLLSILLQVIAVLAYFVVALALSMDAGWDRFFEFMAYFNAGGVVAALPGPPQGLGTMELAYRYFFAPYGSPSQIICMAFAIRIVILTAALPGVLVTLTGAYRPRKAFTPVSTESPEPPVRAHHLTGTETTAGVRS